MPVDDSMLLSLKAWLQPLLIKKNDSNFGERGARENQQHDNSFNVDIIAEKWVLVNSYV